MKSYERCKMRVTITDNRKVTRPIYIQGVSYILSSGKKHFFDIDKDTVDKLSTISFLSVEKIEDCTNESHEEERSESSIGETKLEIQEDIQEVKQEPLSEIVNMDSITCESETQEVIKTEENKTEEKPDYSMMTTQQLRDLLEENNVNVSGMKKRKELLALVEEKLG